MIDINVHIKAPELVHAILALAGATDKRADSVTSAAAALERHDTPTAPAVQPAQSASMPQQTLPPAYTAGVVTQATPAQNMQPFNGGPAPSAVPTYPQQPQPVPTYTAPPTTPDPITGTGTVPTSVQPYTMEQLAVAATQLVDAGRRTDLVQLLSSFGAQALTALPKEQYGAFATQLRARGVKL